MDTLMSSLGSTGNELARKSIMWPVFGLLAHKKYHGKKLENEKASQKFNNDYIDSIGDLLVHYVTMHYTTDYVIMHYSLVYYIHAHVNVQ